MTTLQPRLMRADTLDLQSHDAPSAQDHSRSPTFTPYVHGSVGTHHREALRHAEESAYNERRSSPRASMDESNPNNITRIRQYDSAEDDEDEEHPDGADGDPDHEGDYEEGNEEGDDDLEDDLMDKISSSPSIEDGKYPHFLWPPRIDSRRNGAPLPSSSVPIRGIFPPSPECSTSLPFANMEDFHQVSRHLSGSPSTRSFQDDLEENDLGPSVEAGDHKSWDVSKASPFPSTRSGSDIWGRDSIADYLLPINDPFLDDECDDESMDHDENSWVDEGNPWYEEGSSSDDDGDDFPFTADSRFIDSGWGGECLREIEDIDFEFVYALHTFVATVEGQANATKGDTMVLLDDSNSYWWLVRVVKDGSIGYLPAEHIETPTERLARLNKHRNIDLSASMLGDNPEKSKNPLKKAMRRRNAKTVAFTAPTYYEPSEYEYSSEEEDDDQMTDGAANAQGQQSQQSQQIASQDSVQANNDREAVVVNGLKKVASDDQMSSDSSTSQIKSDSNEQASAQMQPEENIQRSRNGTVRNTDSFFKDDTIETRKISLTPRLLRNDTDSAASGDAALRAQSSAETFDKMLGSDDKVKEKEKEKEKKKEKKGMLSGLFKRKDKNNKAGKAEEEEKIDEAQRVKESIDSVSGPQSPERKPSKLQKQPPAGISPKASPTEAKLLSKDMSAATSPTLSSEASDSPGFSSNAKEGQQEPQQVVADASRTGPTPNRFPSLTEKRSIFAPITTVLKSSPAGDAESSTKPVYSKRAKERFAIDVSDSEDDQTPTASHVSGSHRSISPVQDTHLDISRSDSAMEVSPVDASDSEDHEPALESAMRGGPGLGIEDEKAGQNRHESAHSDTASTSKPSPSLATHTPSTSRSTPTWSDASLRSYMDSDQDIRDLLIIVHDKSNITPVGADHPLMGGLFMTERTRLAEMQTQLDSMLTTWISKRNPGLLAK